MTNSYKNKLVVAETFYSVQGEGVTTGCPSVFLRLAGCNLLCGGRGQGNWVCDTIEVWKHGVATAFPDILTEEQLNMLRRGAHLVITGGEPLLQQKQIEAYLTWLLTTQMGGKLIGAVVNTFIEVETNGTVVPSVWLRNVVDQWNVSFKLSNSGECWEQRVNETALQWFNNSMLTMFKIVIGQEEDIQELIQDFIAPGLIDPRKLVLMPAGATQYELEQVREWLIRRCKELVMRYTDRLHIVAWNQKTGV